VHCNALDLVSAQSGQQSACNCLFLDLHAPPRPQSDPQLNDKPLYLFNAYQLVCLWLQEEGACVEAAVSHLSSLLEGMPGRSGWKVTLTHVERVKWYAPRIRHLVGTPGLVPDALPRATCAQSPQHPAPSIHIVAELYTEPALLSLFLSC
jgi:hypothetical protein